MILIWRASLVAAPLLLLPGTAMGAIALDATSSSTTSGTTLNLSHTIGSGVDRLLIVTVAVEATAGAADLTATPTYDGVPMTKAVDRAAGSSYHMNCEIWYLLDASLPAAGSYTISIQASGADDISAGAISLTGAAQVPPEATGASDDGETGSSTIQTAIATASDNSWIVDVTGSGNSMSGMTPDGGQTEFFDVNNTSSHAAGSYEIKPTAGGETLGWTTDQGSNRLTHVVAAFAPTSPVTINYRSIGIDSGTLYSAGTASVAAGSSTVTFSGATLPDNVGIGDELTITSVAPPIAFDLASNVTRSNVTVATMNHTIGSGSNRILVVCTAHEAFPPVAVTGVTYDGVALTLAGVEETVASQGQRVEMWYLLEAALPAAGTYQVAVTFAGSVSPGIGAISLANVAQQAPEATGSNECASCTTISTTVTTLTDGAWVISNVGNGQSGSYTHGGGQTERWDQAPSSMVHSASTKLVASAGPTAIQEIASTSCNRQALFAAAFAPVNGSDSTLHILSRDSASQVTVQSPAQQSHSDDTYTIKRAYNTLQGWEDDREGNLVAEARREVGICYDDGDFTPGSQVLIDGSTTDANAYMMLTAAAGHEHSGIAGNGVAIDLNGLNDDCINIQDEYTVIERLEIMDWTGNGNEGVRLDAIGSTARDLLIHDFQGASGGILISQDASVRNTMIYDGSNDGIKVLLNSGAHGVIENVTIYDMGRDGVRGESGASVEIRNTIAVGCTGSDFNLSGTITYFGYNMFETTAGFDPASFQGNNQVPPLDPEDLFVSIFPSYDLHLESGGNAAVNRGDDLSSTFTTDIDDETRNVNLWDIGADETLSRMRVISWKEVEP